MASIRSLRLLASSPVAPAVAAVATASSSLHQRASSSSSSVVLRISRRKAFPGVLDDIGRSASSSTSSSSSSSSRSSSSRRPGGGGVRSRALPLIVLAVGSAATSAMAAVAEDEGRISTKGDGEAQSDLMTEFMVNMSCEGCVKSVRTRLEPLDGVKTVNVDLPNQVVRVLGSASIKNLSSAIEQTGRDFRLIGQGFPSDFAISAAVAEFKGPQVNGVVRFAQVSMEVAKIDAFFNGLTPGDHAWSINMYGDLTRGAASTGGILDWDSPPDSKAKPLGDLGILQVNSNGEADYSGTKASLQVSELIGRSIVLYDNSDNSRDGITAAVIARSAGVGENYKKLCSCDGTVIWEATNNDFVRL